VYVCEPRTVDDVGRLLSDLCILLDRPGDYPGWMDKLEDRKNDLTSIRLVRKPLKFCYLVWWSPAIMAGGETYISSLLSEGPFQNVFGDVPRYPEIPVEKIYRREIDIVFLSSEPYDFSDEKIDEINRAAGGIRVERIDGRMCGWYGTRTVTGLNYLSDLSNRLMKK